MTTTLLPSTTRRGARVLRSTRPRLSVRPTGRGFGARSMTLETGASVTAAPMVAETWTRGLYRLAGECLAEGNTEPLRAPFLSRGPGWARAISRLDAGRRPAVFAKGNGKLPFYAFSSLAGHDCPQAGACLYRSGDRTSGVMSGFCYSFKSWRYPGAFVRQLVNSLRLRSKEGREEILAAWFALPHGATVRLYVDGDFCDLATSSFWFRLCHARPDLRVYGYSKSWAILLEYARGGGAFPENYLLNISSGGAGTDAEREAVAALPITRGEFVAVETAADHGRAYQSKHLPGWAGYAADIRQQAAPARVFVCPGRCGDCTSSGHACGSEKFRGVKIAIGIH